MSKRKYIGDDGELYDDETPAGLSKNRTQIILALIAIIAIIIIAIIPFGTDAKPLICKIISPASICGGTVNININSNGNETVVRTQVVLELSQTALAQTEAAIATKSAPTQLPIATNTPTMTATSLPQNTATALPTLTIPATFTPTIPPSDEMGPLAINQTWDGAFTQYNVNSIYKMVMRIEQVQGTTFTGYLRWTSPLRNGKTTMNGEIVTDFGDFVEQSKWEHLKEIDPKPDGVWLKFTETNMVQGSDVNLNGWYYAHIGTDNIMRGVWFDTSGELGGDFALTLQN